MKSSKILLLIAGSASGQTRNPGQIGVTIYEHADNNGEGVGWSGFFGPGMHTGDFPNDVVTSYEIDENCCATFFEHYDYLGQDFSECGAKKGNVPDNWNDVISSMKVLCFEKGDFNEGKVIDADDDKFKLDHETLLMLKQLEYKHWDEQVKDYNEANGIVQWGIDSEPPVWQIIPGWIVFVLMWALMFYPNVQDIVFFCYYAMYDFGSSVDIYVWDHENGWFYWNIISFAISVGTIGFYIWVFVARYVLDQTYVYQDLPQMVAFMVTNSVALGLTLAKYAMIWYESALEWDDCGYFNCFWALNSYVGQINLEVEMYPDIFKTAGFVANYFVWLMFPWIDDWMNGRTQFWS